MKLILIILIFGISSCSTDEGTEITNGGIDNGSSKECDSSIEACVDLSNDKPPLSKLSDYGFFLNDLEDLAAKSNVIEYEPSSSLFTDYAEKSRFIYFPKGSKATYNGNYKVLNFPLNTIIIKNFFYYTDARDPALGKRIIETRLLVKREDRWSAYEYEWNASQTDATRLVSGKNSSAISTITNDGVARNISGYLLPSESQCAECHSVNGSFSPIGPKASNLNWVYNYAEGSMNQLDKWVEKGYLSTTNLPPRNTIVSMPNYMDESVSDENRGRAYLDMNCAHCHSPFGKVVGNGFYVNYDYVGPDISKGIYKKPTTYQGSGLTYNILPQDPDKSVVIYRMSNTNPAHIMPQLGRSVNHEKGIEIVSNYIEALPVSD